MQPFFYRPEWIIHSCFSIDVAVQLFLVTFPPSAVVSPAPHLSMLLPVGSCRWHLKNPSKSGWKFLIIFKNMLLFFLHAFLALCIFTKDWSSIMTCKFCLYDCDLQPLLSESYSLVLCEMLFLSFLIFLPAFRKHFVSSRPSIKNLNIFSVNLFPAAVLL